MEVLNLLLNFIKFNITNVGLRTTGYSHFHQKFFMEFVFICCMLYLFMSFC